MKLSSIQSFSILGLSVHSNEAEIKAAYKRKAKLFHPDLNKAPEAQSQFIQLRSAYEICLNHFRHSQKTKFSQPETHLEAARKFEQQYKRKVKEKIFKDRVYRNQRKKKQNPYNIVIGVFLILLAFLNFYFSGLSIIGLAGIILLRFGIILIIKELPKRRFISGSK